MRRAAQDPRARVFVLFLDPRHVDVQGSLRVRRPLIEALNALIGGGDCAGNDRAPARGAGARCGRRSGPVSARASRRAESGHHHLRWSPTSSGSPGSCRARTARMSRSIRSGRAASRKQAAPLNERKQLMADITDGRAVLQPVSLETGLRHMVDDLSSYLSRRVLLEREAGRPLPSYCRAREAPRCAGSRALRRSRPHRRAAASCS